MVCAGFMIGMDFTGAAAIVTSIEADFGVDLTTTQWMLTIYALTFGMGIVTAGKLGDVFGHRRMLLIGMAIFAIASATIALSPDVWIAIGARGVQGVGGALIWPAIVAISFNSVPASMSATAVGFVLGGAGFGNAIGPIIAGVGAELLSWTLLFWVNVPLAIVVGALVLTHVRRDAERSGREPLDLRGIAVLTVALFCAMFALDIGASVGWTSPGVITLFLVAFAGVVLFFVLEPRAVDPLIPPELTKDPGFVAALLANGLLVPVWFSVFLYIPQYLQKSLDTSALLGAVAIVPGMLVFAVFSPLSGRFYQALGPRVLIGIGYLAMILAGINFAIADPSWGYLGILPGILLVGVGAGAAIGSAGTAAVSAVDEQHSGLAGGLSFMVHLLFGAIGVAIATAVFTTQASLTATGDEFAEGMNAVFVFATIVAVIGLVNSYFIRTKDVRRAEARG
jgi:EmrB/QacA subfamily drug resistance transporter